MNEKWFCGDCYKAIGEEVECFTMTPAASTPCVVCGTHDIKEAKLVCNPQVYVYIAARARIRELENRLRRRAIEIAKDISGESEPE